MRCTSKWFQIFVYLYHLGCWKSDRPSVICVGGQLLRRAELLPNNIWGYACKVGCLVWDQEDFPRYTKKFPMEIKIQSSIGTNSSPRGGSLLLILGQ